MAQVLAREPGGQCPHCGSQMTRGEYSEGYGEAEDTPWMRESIPSPGEYESIANESFPISGESPFLLGSGGEATSEAESWETADEGETSSELESFESPEDHDGRLIAREASLEDPREAESSAEFEKLTADEIASLFGRKSSLVALHWLLASNELQRAALAALFGKAGRRSVSVHGSSIPMPSYLRLVSRLCREAAEQTERELSDARENESDRATFGWDREAASSGAGPLTEAQIAGSPTETQTMQDAFDASRRSLRDAIPKLDSLVTAISNSKGKPLDSANLMTFRAVVKWLNVEPKNPLAALPTIRSARDLMNRNLQLKTSSGGDPPMRRGPVTLNGVLTSNFHTVSYVGEPDRGINCGDPFFNDDGPNCHRDAVTHEYFHMSGVHHGGGPMGEATHRELIKTPAQALDSADHLAQLVAQLTTRGGRTDACVRKHE